MCTVLGLDIAIRFLTTVRSRGPWTLTALHPDRSGAPTETWIGKSEIPQMRDWIASHNTHAGIYFTANPTSARMHRRPCEDDIAAFQYAALDFDPLKTETPVECRTRVFTLLREAAMPPTFVWSTGNGVQGLWRCKPVIMLEDKATRAKCKSATLGLIQSLRGADATQSLEHLFRVAGTINHPNANKRAAGRSTKLAGDFQYWRERTYELGEFPKPVLKGTLERARGLKSPVQGWDTTHAIGDGSIYLQTTEDTAREGRSGTCAEDA